ncbi:MAG: hypothetical protein ACYS9V_13755 [Planctomycetota bacterium]|jgi:hypothetical protein
MKRLLTICAVVTFVFAFNVLAPVLIPVSIDIKPGSCPNPLNINSKGVLPVAILGTGDFDVQEIDPASIRLADVVPLSAGALKM